MREYAEKRGLGLFVTGTSVAIESVVYEYKAGLSPESILLAYPGLRSLENIYGAITYYLAHRDETEAYLLDTESRWEQGRREQQLPQQLRERLERARQDVISPRS